jgi:hypothetical protein
MYQRYSGIGRDLAKGESCAIEGWRLTEPDVLEWLAGMGTRREQIMELITRFS